MTLWHVVTDLLFFASGFFFGLGVNIVRERRDRRRRDDAWRPVSKKIDG